MKRRHFLMFAGIRPRTLWLLAVSALPLFGMVAAFGVAPDTDTRPIPARTLVESLTPALSPAPAGQDYYRIDQVERGDTVNAVLQRMGIDDADIQTLLATPSVRGAGLARLRSGQRLEARVSADGRLQTLAFGEPGADEARIARRGDGFAIDPAPPPAEDQVLMRSGGIRGSLYDALDAARVPEGVAEKMLDLFSGDLDFRRDLRPDDHFSIVYRVRSRAGEAVGEPEILAAEFINQGHVYRAVLYKTPRGQDEYYTPEGRPLKKTFLKSPLDNSRITSGFTLARYHPLLHAMRAHKGVDYAAPVGARVKTVADGSVSFAGWQSGYGRLVVVQHAGRYSTAYGHLSGFAPGVHRGARVVQGQAIGYVGQSGLATGPHLHYEFRVAGVQKNPLALNLPSAQALSGPERARFLASSRIWTARLDLLRGTRIAALD